MLVQACQDHGGGAPSFIGQAIVFVAVSLAISALLNAVLPNIDGRNDDGGDCDDRDDDNNSSRGYDQQFEPKLHPGRNSPWMTVETVAVTDEDGFWWLDPKRCQQPAPGESTIEPIHNI